MSITDEDTGTFADFTLRIDGPLSELFDIQPKFATGHVRPVIRVKKAFDYENPNERKFLLLVGYNTYNIVYLNETWSVKVEMKNYLIFYRLLHKTRMSQSYFQLLPSLCQ